MLTVVKVSEIKRKRAYVRQGCPQAELYPEILNRAVFWSILIKDQRHFAFFVHSFNHIKGFETKVEWCCTTLPLYRETPAQGALKAINRAFCWPRLLVTPTAIICILCMHFGRSRTSTRMLPIEYSRWQLQIKVSPIGKLKYTQWLQNH